MVLAWLHVAIASLALGARCAPLVALDLLHHP
jgi:hypothetical protein